MSVKNQNTAIEVEETDTRSIQTELYACEDILDFMSETLNKLGNDAFQRHEKDLGTRLQTIGRVLDDVNVRLYRITDSEVATDLEFPA